MDDVSFTECRAEFASGSQRTPHVPHYVFSRDFISYIRGDSDLRTIGGSFTKVLAEWNKISWNIRRMRYSRIFRNKFYEDLYLTAKQLALLHCVPHSFQRGFQFLQSFLPLHLCTFMCVYNNSCYALNNNFILFLYFQSNTTIQKIKFFGKKIIFQLDRKL